MPTVYVPSDSAARSVGAEEVATAVLAEAQRRGETVDLVRNGSRGMYWLEPLVEVATPSGRVAYGPVRPEDVPDLFDAGLLAGAAGHRLAHGPTDQIEFLARQHRITFARVGLIDPLSPGDYEAHGGLAGLRRAIELGPEGVIALVSESGLRGRGGAGFPTGTKWAGAAQAHSELKFVCCNADEGDSGTFADRMLMEGDPFTLVEGMAIAALAVGATEGFVYIRSEYPAAVATMRTAIEIADLYGWIGESILDSGQPFRLAVRVGAGAYVCGEESSMLESLEGRRGMVRARPPLPVHEGLFAKPTVVNNVLSLSSVPAILAQGASAYAELGMERSRGTQVFQLAGNIARGGIVEVPFGVTLGELVEGFGGGTRTGRPIRAVQVGGPLGAYLPTSSFALPMDYEAFAAADAIVGHGGIVVFDDTVDMARQARFAMEFCAEESCGKCTPCRIGSVRGMELLDQVIADDQPEARLEVLNDLLEVMTEGSLCALGGLAPMPVRSALAHFSEDFARSARAGAGADGATDLPTGGM